MDAELEQTNPFPPRVRGSMMRLSPPRRFVGDLLAFAKKVPSVPMQRRMRLEDVVSARATWPRHISWTAIFLKAYGLVAAHTPELRRSYIPFPWPHLYEHPMNVASFSLERVWRGEPGVFFAQIAEPEKFSLADLDKLVRTYKSADMDSVPSFRRAMFLSRFPRPIRRFVWWLGLCTDGMQRSRYFGTFGFSVVAQFGAAGLHLLSPLTTSLNYGAFEPDGSIDVRVVYDHRVLDGATMARAMTALEETLHGSIYDELRAGASRQREYEAA